MVGGFMECLTRKMSTDEPMGNIAIEKPRTKKEQAIEIIKQKKLNVEEAYLQEIEFLDGLLDYIESSEDERANMNAYFDDPVEKAKNEQRR